MDGKKYLNGQRRRAVLVVISTRRRRGQRREREYTVTTAQDDGARNDDDRGCRRTECRCRARCEFGTVRLRSVADGRRRRVHDSYNTTRTKHDDAHRLDRSSPRRQRTSKTSSSSSYTIIMVYLCVQSDCFRMSLTAEHTE